MKTGKTKFIRKALKNNPKTTPTDEEHQGEPVLKSLSDFVTAVSPIFASKPIYTGGRILTAQGKIYASCNQAISVYDLTSNLTTSSIRIHNEEIVNFAVNSSATRIAVYTQNGLLRIMDLPNLTVLQITRLNTKLFPNDLAFSPDSKHLAIGFASQLVKIFTTYTLKQTHNYHHKAAVRKVEWDPRPDLLQVISSDDDNKIYIFDYIANKVVSEADAGHVFSVFGKRLASIRGKEVRLYDLKQLTFINSVTSDSYLQTVYLMADSVVFGGQDTPLLTWNIRSSRTGSVKDGTQNGVMKILGWPKQNKLIVVSAEQNMHVIDGGSFCSEEVIVGYNDQIIDIKFSKTAHSDLFLLITNSATPKLIHSDTHKLHTLLKGHTDIVLCGEYFHPYLLTAGKDKTIKLWRIDELGQPRLFCNYLGHSDDVCGLAWLMDSKLIVSVGEDKTIKLWPLCEASEQVEIHNSLLTVMGHEKSIHAVRVSQKHKLIATCSHDRTVKIWDTQLTKLFTLAGHRRGVWDATFHHKEALIVTAGADGMLKGWSLIDGSCVWSMGEGSGLVRCQWLYEHQVVTGSVDGILKIWDVRKMTSLSYDKHQGKIWALQVVKEQNGKCKIATGANDSVYQIWKDTTEQTTANLLHQAEVQQQQALLIEQHRINKQYLEAAKVAFTNNYTQKFVEIVEEIVWGSPDRQIETDEEGNIVQQAEALDISQAEAQLYQLIVFASQADINRLLGLVLKMNSTVRHFKTANCLFNQLLKLKKIKGMLSLQRTYGSSNNFQLRQAQKQSEFMNFVKDMQLYTQKHLRRIEKYSSGTLWLDHISTQR